MNPDAFILSKASGFVTAPELAALEKQETL